MSFRIRYVNFEGMSIPFYKDIDSNNENLYTILIGKNGSGKSRALSIIANTLCSIYVGNKLLKRDIGTLSQYKQDEHYSSLSISSGGCDVKIETHGRSIISSFDRDVVCPRKIIAASTSPFDKFPRESVYFSGSDGSVDFYNYYGLDDNSKNKALLLLVEKLFFSVADTHLSENKYTIGKLLGFLGFESDFELHFRLKHGINKFMRNLSGMDEREFMNYVSSASQRDLSYLQSKHDISYTKLRDAFVTLSEYCGKDESSRVIIFNVHFDSLKINKKMKGFLTSIKVLSDIGILNIHDVIVSRKTNRAQDGWQWWENSTESFSINDASSGQQCILLNILGIAASIEDNSLILIDEPEISLHPEWQETYINLLIDAFTHIKGCHFVIATHSPQIVSNLKYGNCFVSIMESEDVVTSSNFMNKSADFQLATLFDAPGIENEYLKRVSINILSALSNGTFIHEEYYKDLELLKKNREKIEQEDSVRKLIDLAIEIAGRL
ncbi:AAA family ATPase [Serratia sp. IR-2025]|uniref:AAA family ATPase n=1 Tax=Serratia nevei TaxID=2703794 RepID=UPI0027D343DE|nr:AAA family ATPase [Serratia nevei]WMC75703.1 AAA family ATPase [Serratia nevei]WMC81105.1 AAA family ATPase [Serratia nevei]